MKIVAVVTVVILSSIVVLAQDVADMSAPPQSTANVKKHEHKSEPEDKELLGDSAAEAEVEEPSLELDDTETDFADFESEIASEVHDFDEPESVREDTPPADKQRTTEFPPPFDQSTVDSSDVAQVVNFIVLIYATCWLRH